MTPHPDDVTIIFLDYDVIIFDDVNPYGIVTSLCLCVPGAEPPFTSTGLLLKFTMNNCRTKVPSGIP